MKEVGRFYCDTPELLKELETGQTSPDIVRHLSLYIDKTQPETKGYFATYYPKAKEGKIFREIIKGDNLLERLKQAAEKFANQEEREQDPPYRVLKRKYMLVPIEG